MSESSSSRKNLIVALIVAAVLAAGYFAFTSRKGGDSAELQYRLAVLIAETGNFAFTGKPIRNVLELASEQNRAALLKDGIDIQFQWSDTQGNPKEAVTAFNRAADVGKANGVLTNLSGQTLAVAPLAKGKSVLHFGITIDPAFLKDHPTGLRFQFSAATEADQIVKAALERKWGQMLVLHSTDASTMHVVTRLIAPKLESAGVKVTLDTFNPGQRDLNTLCGKYAKQDWSGVVYHGFGNDMPFLAEACAAYPNIAKAPKVCAVGCLDAPPAQRKQLAGIQLVGPSFYVSPSPEIKRFQELYAAKFPDQALPWHALYAYDAYAVLADILRGAKTTDAKALRPEFGKPHKGLTQQYKFDNNGDVTTETVWLEFAADGTVRAAAGTGSAGK